jgi:ATP-dependent Clp protease adaptor protein ClpS
MSVPARVNPVTVAVLQKRQCVAARQRLVRMDRMATKHDPSTVLERQESRLKPPPMYQVMLLNDDYTPMEFVVSVLQKFFGMGREKATQVMLKVHREGRGVCGVYPRDVAATKVEQVSSYSRQHQHPLQCVMEEA